MSHNMSLRYQGRISIAFFLLPDLLQVVCHGHLKGQEALKNPMTKKILKGKFLKKRCCYTGGSIAR